MKKSEFKRLVKPIIKETLREMILEEEGMFSTLIKEVLSLKNTEPIIETKKSPIKQNTNKKKEKINESKERLSSVLADSPYSKIFENINKPIADEKKVNVPGSPLRGIDPNDPGIDISQFGF